MINRYQFADGYEISQLIKGGWHLAGGHGYVDPSTAISDMARFVDEGVTTFDCADIYTGVEELIGRFRRQHPDLARQTQVHTKFVPDLCALERVNHEYVKRIVDRSLSRLDVECLDLVQFHWWDFSVPGYVEAAQTLDRLRIQGKIARIGVTNFDTPRLRELVDSGVPIIAHQLQYSLLDRRPSGLMKDYCATNSIAMLCYGTVAGGFLSERWLGKPEPQGALSNRSLVKYKLIIDEFGSWAQFQQLLTELNSVAVSCNVDIATVATKFVLQQSGVGAAIVGATSAKHLEAHHQIAGMQLTQQHLERLNKVLLAGAGPDGDVYGLERDRNGPHGRIMRYELND
jgi:aryl-alcohol dehydrogenase-like predicted oxidoreductase